MPPKTRIPSETIVADLTITVGTGRQHRPFRRWWSSWSFRRRCTSPVRVREDVKRFQVAGTGRCGPARSQPSRQQPAVAVVAEPAQRRRESWWRSPPRVAPRKEPSSIPGPSTVIAEVALHSGDQAGHRGRSPRSRIGPTTAWTTASRTAVTDVDTIPIGSGEIASLTFTGPYPGAVAQRRNNTLPLGRWRQHLILRPAFTAARSA
jgi:hypothetical protein